MSKIISFFQWIIFVIFIPLIALLIVAGAVLHFSGFDILGKATEVAEYFNGSDEIEKIQAVLDETKTNLEDKSSSEKKLLSEVKKKEKEITSYKEEIDKLKGLLKASENNQKVQEDVIKSYENMTPEKAAEILSKLSAEDKEQAVKILKGMKPDALAQILENMEPSVAASLTRGITK